MFSIIIPLYNKELSVKNTIKSVLNQSFKEFEIIVVNDGSTDKSVEKAKEISDERIKIIDQENQGVSAARNRGIKEAKFHWIIFLDADDLWLDNHLQEINRLISKYPTFQVFASSYRRSDNKVIKLWREDVEDYIVDDYFYGMLHQHIVCTGCIVIRSAIFDMIDAFNPALEIGEDIELWGRIGKLFPIVKSNTVTVVYNVDAKNRISLGKYKMDKSIFSVLDFKKMEKETEIEFYKMTIVQKIKDFIIHGDIKNLMFLLKKYGLKLLW